MTLTDNVPKKKRKTRLSDVAAKAKLSTSAVSMALADHPNISTETKRRVLRISEEMGYARAHASVLRQSDLKQAAKGQTLGFAMVGSRIDDPAYAAMLHGFVVKARRCGATMQVTAVESRDADATVEPLLDFATRLDGVILVGCIGAPLLEQIQARALQAVAVGHVMLPPGAAPPRDIPIVAPDDVEMGRMATGYLLKQNHRRIAFISETIPTGLSHSRWLTGYRAAHLELDIMPDPALIHIAGELRAGGRPAAETLARLDAPPTALVVPDSPLAASFLRHFQTLGRHIDRSAVVAGGNPQRAEEYGLEEGALVYCDPQRIVDAAFDLLVRKVQGTFTPGVDLTVRMSCRNLSPHGNGRPQ